MERPDPAVFREPGWPQAFLNEDLTPWFERAERQLGVRDDAGEKTIERLRGHKPRGVEALRGLEASRTRPGRIQVAFDEQPRGAAAWPHKTCAACGDCATGCNHEAKQSLDTSLLCRPGGRARSWSAARAWKAWSCCPRAGWRVQVQHTDELLRDRQGEAFEVVARRVILAAGSLGSTEILMRSRERGLRLSRMLGQGFSANGDVITVGHELPKAVHAVADERQAPGARQVGPTITAMLSAGGDHVVQDPRGSRGAAAAVRGELCAGRHAGRAEPRQRRPARGARGTSRIPSPCGPR
ncbi:cholesterol oxidase [Ditylenchus destructor]|nr:cholesterol oxidase [Ditylenchus destructor]